MEAQTYWTEEQLRQWLQLQRTPAKTMKLIRKQWGGRMWPGNPEEPFSGLTSFWQRQLFDSDENKVAQLKAWLDISDTHFMITRSCADYLNHLNILARLRFYCLETVIEACCRGLGWRLWAAGMLRYRP